MKWLHALPELLAHQEVVLVTVAQTRGSVPREPGTSMLVTMTDSVDTIGGGHLEWEAMAHARAMLLQPRATPSMQRLPLGASLGQCCGGVVWLVFERVAQTTRDTWLERSRLLDAGSSLVRTLVDCEEASQWRLCNADEAASHTATHLDTHSLPSPGPDGPPSPMLGRGNGNARARRQPGPLSQTERTATRESEDGAPTPPPSANTQAPLQAAWRLTHHLTRPSFHITLFGAGHVGAAIVRVLATLDASVRWVDVRDDLFGEVPEHVVCITTDVPEDEVDNAPPDSFFLVLTHSHALDLQLTARILRRGTFAWFGLIGSRTKRARFEQRLLAQGIPAAQLARMTCPIGVSGIRDKAPSAIAIAVVAQLLRAKEAGELRRNAYDDRKLTHEN